MQVFKPLCLLLLAGCAPTLAADEHRQHGAHEHGTGKLDIAQEGVALHIALDSPAVNIVGFEHAPKSQEDHETLETALAGLKNGAGLFALPKAAACRLVDADAQTPLADHEQGQTHHDEHEHRAEHEPDARHEEDVEHEGDHEHEGGHEHNETHADITATWHFDCAHPEALDQVGVRLFEAFPNTKRLQVQYVTGKHQGAAELSASQPIVRF